MVPPPIKTTNKNSIPKVRQKRATQLIRHPYYSIAGISSHEVLIIARIRIQEPVLISDTWFGIQFFGSISGMPTNAVILRWPDKWTFLCNSHSCSAPRGYRQVHVYVMSARVSQAPQDLYRILRKKYGAPYRDYNDFTRSSNMLLLRGNVAYIRVTSECYIHF